MEHKQLIFKYLQTTGKTDIVAVRVDGEMLSNMAFNHTTSYKNA